ncbi:MAG TPA: hypothetical protein VFJ58_12165 [Armatimonadota bacterium]|nr:hypothetical protein [Armatimonadota bacterium]
MFQFNKERPQFSKARIGIWILIAAVSGLASASSLSPPVSHDITLHASMIVITAKQIVATGSPLLSSDQGSVAANEFTVSLDPEGHATQASAKGGVRFTLSTKMGAWRTASGTCDDAILYPQERRTVLLGGLTGMLQGPGASPISLRGASRADLFGTVGGKLARFVVQGPSVVTTRT